MSGADGLKLVIQIPCLNEAEQLPATLADLPREVPGFAVVEWLVVDDGSTDGTARVAEECGVDHIVRLGTNRGLAAAFMSGIEASLRVGADVIVNTDADNQYDAWAIPALVAPILAGEAHMVVGVRPIAEHATFSPLKKRLQRLGSRMVRLVSGTTVADATSGFRAISRELAARLFVFNRYTYTLETIIQAGRMNMRVASVPVSVNPDTRASRLIRSMWGYVARSAVTIVRIFVYYRPLRFFAIVGGFVMLPGLLAFARFLLAWIAGQSGGHIQSLVIGASLIAAGVVIFVGGIVADLVAANRMLLQDIRSRMLLAQLDEAASHEGTAAEAAAGSAAEGAAGASGEERAAPAAGGAADRTAGGAAARGGDRTAGSGADRAAGGPTDRTAGGPAAPRIVAAVQPKRQ